MRTFSDSTLRPRIVIRLFATFVAEPLTRLLNLTPLDHWLLRYKAAVVAGRKPARVATVVLVPPIFTIVEVLARLRLLALAAPRGLDIFLAFSLATAPERSLILEGLGHGPSVRPSVRRFVPESVRPPVCSLLRVVLGVRMSVRPSVNLSVHL
jgi:hypothetical protein